VSSEEGQSAVVVPVPAAEPVVSTWRARFVGSAAQGMPAHITALYPFLPEEDLTGAVVSQLREICAAVRVLAGSRGRGCRFGVVAATDSRPDLRTAPL
jgi:hypothetical protein